MITDSCCEGNSNIPIANPISNIRGYTSYHLYPPTACKSRDLRQPDGPTQKQPHRASSQRRKSLGIHSRPLTETAFFDWAPSQILRLSRWAERRGRRLVEWRKRASLELAVQRINRPSNQELILRGDVAIAECLKIEGTGLRILENLCWAGFPSADVTSGIPEDVNRSHQFLIDRLMTRTPRSPSHALPCNLT